MVIASPTAVAVALEAVLRAMSGDWRPAAVCRLVLVLLIVLLELRGFLVRPGGECLAKRGDKTNSFFGPVPGVVVGVVEEKVEERGGGGEEEKPGGEGEEGSEEEALRAVRTA